MACWATAWVAIASAVRTASNWLTRSAELTICLPRERRNSTVPASTMETYMMSLLGEYCMAMVCWFWRRFSRPACELLPA